jgi:hypothetical protein
LALALKLSMPVTWRSFTWSEGMPGKPGPGAAGEFVRERFRERQKLKAETGNQIADGQVWTNTCFLKRNEYEG